MNLESLKLNQFRNYEKETLLPNNGLNIIYGKNAQGKTNIVEAIYYLSTGKSFRTSRDSQMIMFDRDYTYIKAAFNTLAGKNVEEAMIKKDGTKSFKINAMPVKKLGHLFGNFSCIAFTPEDVKAIKEAPSMRRKLIDVEISKIKPAYFFELKSYYKTLAEKNALLKGKIGEDEKRLIYVYNEQLSKNADVIMSLRDTFLKEIADDFIETYYFLSGTKNIAQLKYKPCISSKNIAQDFLDKLNKNIRREIDYKQSFFGPHKEDIVFYLDNKDVKSFGSQGQQRTIMLAYKLSVMNMIKKRTEESPVLVLDDVFSELDFSRQRNLCEFLSSSQVFITTAVPININSPYKAFIIDNGKINEKS